MDKLTTIIQHQALNKYDFSIPTIVYDSVGSRGHVGLIAR